MHTRNCAGTVERDDIMEPKLERTDTDEVIKREKEAIKRLLDLADERKLNEIYNFILHIL